MSLFTYAAIVSVILAVILAAARDVPLFHLLVLPEVEYGEVVPNLLAFGWLVCLAVGWGSSHPTIVVICQAAVWIGGLAYFWWSAIWHLKERR